MNESGEGDEDSDGSPREGMSDLLPLYFIHDEVYILLRAGSGQPTNYSLFYNSGSIQAQLKDGVIQPIRLSQRQPNATVVYEHYDLEVNPLLVIAPLNKTSLNDI